VTKRRRKSRPRTSAAVDTEPTRASTSASEARRREPPAPRGLFSRAFVDSPFPPIGRSLVRGFVIAGSSVELLAIAFVLLFVLWIGLVALGLEGPPGRLVDLLALPPISTYFDALNGVAIYGLGGVAFVAATVFIVVRSVILSILAALVVQQIEGGGPIRDALVRGLRAIPVVIASGILALSAMILGSVLLPILGAGLGFLGSVVTLVGAMFFLVYVPIIAVRMDLGAAETIRRSGRAAMMPGSRHLMLCLLYVFLTLPILVAVAPGGSLLGVNPSVGMWAFAIVCTFVHLAFLTTFAYRWIEAEDQVPDAPVRVRRR
jgi:hypothetical protein